jgi:hypothetical protein
VGDEELGGRLVDVQRERLTEGADAALQVMFGGVPERAVLPPVERPVLPLAEGTPGGFEEAAAEAIEVTSGHPAKVPATGGPEVPFDGHSEDGPDGGRGGHPQRPKLHVICGAGRHHQLAVPDRPQVPSDGGLEVPPADGSRLPAEQARLVIESAWAKGTPPTETARLSTRSVTWVKKEFARLDKERTQTPARLALVRSVASA